MTNADVVVRQDAHEAVPTAYELGSMSTQTLRAELARSLTHSARTLARLAAIWRELEKRGEDLSDLRVGLAAYLPLIAAGQLDAEVVVRFAGQPTTLRLMATLPVEEQRRLAKGAPVPVLTADDDGNYSTMQMPATSLTPAQMRLVLDTGRVRPVEEQRAVLEAAKLSRARRTRPGQDARVRYDSRDDRVHIGRTSASVGEVVSALAAACQQPAAEEDPSSRVMILLTEEEHRGLKIRATEAGMTLQDFARSLLVMRALL